MKYLSVNEIASLWKLSARSVRNYCYEGRIVGAFLEGKTWYIPENAKKPFRHSRTIKKYNNLLQALTMEKQNNVPGGIYHRLQIDFTYNSNHMEGSELSHDETRKIFETNTISFTTIGVAKTVFKVDNIIETRNHFRCVDLAILSAKHKLTESLIKQFHLILKSSTDDSSKTWFNVGGYKKLENEVGNMPTVKPNEVHGEMVKLLDWYGSLEKVTITDIIAFHVKFERIHPFQDGNGRVGRLIMLKECLKHNIVPILIKDDFKEFYYRGLKEWDTEKGYLIDTCLHGQDIVKCYLDYFNIPY